AQLANFLLSVSLLYLKAQRYCEPLRQRRKEFAMLPRHQLMKFLITALAAVGSVGILDI
ncbi:uncharacterized, partial [Tachysurus ichikawai]